MLKKDTLCSVFLYSFQTLLNFFFWLQFTYFIHHFKKSKMHRNGTSSQKKVVLLLEIGWVINFLWLTSYHIPYLTFHILKCVSESIFLFKKRAKKTPPKTHTHYQKAKETKEEKRTTKEIKDRKEEENVVNSIYGKSMMLFTNFLCVFLTWWLSHEFLLLVHMNLTQFMCNRRNCSIHYTITTFKVHTFKIKNKRKSLRGSFVYHLLFYVCLFIAANSL